jgi:hypothetical protein
MSHSDNSTADAVVALLVEASSPLKAAEIVEQLNSSGREATKKLVNSVLYGELSSTSRVEQDASFRWRAISTTGSDIAVGTVEEAATAVSQKLESVEVVTAAEVEVRLNKDEAASEEGREARRIIHTLRSGTTSTRAAKAITVGTSRIERELNTLTDSLFEEGTSGHLVAISADWGFGKSHMRMLLSSHLSDRGIPFIHECVDARAASLAHLHRSIPRWLARIQFGKTRGLRDALLCGKIPSEKASEWASSKYSAFAWGLAWALQGYEPGWLQALGHNYRSPDYPYQHPKSRALLEEIATFLNDIGMGGLVLLLDEAENINQQYDIRGRRKSYDTLARFMEHPHILPIMFVTDRLHYQVEEDCERGEEVDWDNWTLESEEFVTRFRDLEPMRPPRLTDRTAEKLVSNIHGLYRTAYSSLPSHFSAQSVLTHWRQTPTRSVRLLVRLTINELDLCAQNGHAQSQSGSSPH